jgi:hypothetical protein
VRRTFVGSGRRLFSSGLDQCTRIDKSSRDYSIERRNDFRVGTNCFEFIRRRFGLQVLAPRDVDILASDETRIAFPDLLQSIETETRYLEAGLRARDALLKFGHLDFGQDLSFLYPVTLID